MTELSSVSKWGNMPMEFRGLDDVKVDLARLGKWLRLARIYHIMSLVDGTMK